MKDLNSELCNQLNVCSHCRTKERAVKVAFRYLRV